MTSREYGTSGKGEPVALAKIAPVVAVANGPVATLFRVKLQFLNADEASERPVASNEYHVMTITVAATDGEVAVTTARERAHLYNGADSILRLLSVELVDTIDVLALPTETPPASAPSTESAARV